MENGGHAQGNVHPAEEVNLQLNNQGLGSNLPEAPQVNNEPVIASPAAENSNGSVIIIGTSSNSSIIEISDTEEPSMDATGNNAPTNRTTAATADPNNVALEGGLMVPGGNVEEELNSINPAMPMNNLDIRPNNSSEIANNNAPNSPHYFGSLWCPALSEAMQQNNAAAGSVAPGSSGELLRSMAGNNLTDMDFSGTEIGQLPPLNLSGPEIQTLNDNAQLPPFPAETINQNENANNFVPEHNPPIAQPNLFSHDTIMGIGAGIGVPNLDFSTLSFSQLICVCLLTASVFADHWARSISETTQPAPLGNGVLQRAVIDAMLGNIPQQQHMAPNSANGAPHPRPSILSRSQLGLRLPRSVISSATSSDARSPAALQGGGTRSNGVVIRDQLNLGGTAHLGHATHPRPQENGDSSASSAKRPRMEIQAQVMDTHSEENSNEVDPYSEASSMGTDGDQWVPNGLYDPEYERRGLPVDPFLRMFALSGWNNYRK